MKRRLVPIILLIGFIITLGYLEFLVDANTVKATELFVSTTHPQQANSSSQQQSSASLSSKGSNDNTVFEAFLGLIGALATIIAAFITGWLPFHLEKKTEKDRQQSGEKSNKSVRSAKAIKGHAQTYRKSIRMDSRIATLQILDMTQPLDVTDIYVNVRVHDETGLRYKLNRNSLKAEQQHDPNALLKVDREHLEDLYNLGLDPITAIRQYKRCIIVGDPGAGKSTLLKYLALKSAEGSLKELPDLPIHIELNAFAISGYIDILEFAASVWESRYRFPRAEAVRYMRNSLLSGHAILLLDALDEAIIGKTIDESEEMYKHVVNSITNLATSYPLSPIAVTVRKAGYYQRTARLTGFVELEVLDFRQTDIEQFIHQWFHSRTILGKQVSANDLCMRLKRNPRLQSLAANPLLLSLIVIVYEAELDLPDRRTELYKQCVDVLLTKWDASRNIRRRREFKPERKRQLLQEVAWYFHLQGRRYFPEDELLQVIARFLPAIGLSASHNRRILEEIAAENGLLKEQARGWHGFLHLTLQEYFVAQYASDHDKLDEMLKNHLTSWWKEVIILFSGITPDASPLLQRLLDTYYQSGLIASKRQTTIIILAGECLAARPTVRQVTLRGEITSHLFEILVKTTDLFYSHYLAQLLVGIGGKDVYTTILRLISSNQINQNTRRWLAYALGRLGEDSVAADLLQLLLDTSIDMDIRQGVAYAIGETGDHSVLPALRSIFCNPQTNFGLCHTIYYTLYKLEGPSLVPNIQQVISHPQTPIHVRKHLKSILSSIPPALAS